MSPVIDTHHILCGLWHHKKALCTCQTPRILNNTQILWDTEKPQFSFYNGSQYFDPQRVRLATSKRQESESFIDTLLILKFAVLPHFWSRIYREDKWLRFKVDFIRLATFLKRGIIRLASTFHSSFFSLSLQPPCLHLWLHRVWSELNWNEEDFLEKR